MPSFVFFKGLIMVVAAVGWKNFMFQSVLFHDLYIILIVLFDHEVF